LEALQGGGPFSGMWQQTVEWFEEIGYTPDYTEQQCRAIRIAAGKTPD
jgi:hypothetical protein